MVLLANFLAFQIGWFASVLGAANGMPWLGPIAMLLVVGLHLRLARSPSEELLLICACVLTGAMFDSSLVAFGWVSYSSGVFSEIAAPYWIISMWALFATTLNVSLRWLRRSLSIAAVFGLIGGPLTYLAGQKLGAIVLVDSSAAILALGIGWGVMMPLLVRLAENLDGMSGPVRELSGDPG